MIKAKATKIKINRSTGKPNHRLTKAQIDHIKTL